MKVAVAVWKERISPVFDVSGQILVLDIENKAVTRKTEEKILCDNPVRRVCRLAELNVQTLICGAVSQSLANILDAYGIETISFIAGNADEVIDAYLNGILPNPAMSMPGCCRQRIQLGKNSEKQRLSNHPGTREQFQEQKEDNNMPRGDRTGPDGQGPRTGRGKGRCGKQGRQRIVETGNGQGRNSGTEQGQSGQRRGSDKDRKR
ncbi:MAG: hypothetical protein GY795_32785 [Desulfobacterales bacterium]|nr:hypothetical protein [Desulfobacterales bacterium]